MRFAIINELFDLLERSNMDKQEMLNFVEDLRTDVSTAPSLLVNEINDKIIEYCQENGLCSECFSDDVYEDYELYGADADGNRGEMRKVLTCKICGEEI